MKDGNLTKYFVLQYSQFFVHVTLLRSEPPGVFILE
jgi:hypothetical protein